MNNGAESEAPLLRVRGLVKSFVGGGEWTAERRTVRAVDGVDLSVRAGETFCVVGESGCGKSTLARLLVGLESPDAGEVHFAGRRVDNLSPAARRPLRREMQMIFQNPYASLNPRMTTGATLREALRFHFPRAAKSEIESRAVDALTATGLTADALARYPHQFSGGQRQRLSIARALCVEPRFIVADEPVAALDVSVQAQILNLLVELQETRGLTYLFISHDLAVVESFAHTVAVMYLGRICEAGAGAAFFARPLHPYSRALLAAAPRLAGADGREPEAGSDAEEDGAAAAIETPAGCSFHPRCRFAGDNCRHETPALRAFESRQVACHAVFEKRI